MSGYCKYYKQKKQVSYDNGLTWSDTGDYQKGDLYEANSTDCGYVGTITRWIYSGETCNGNDLYSLKIKQESTDGGSTWHLTDPVETRLGDLIEANSSACTSDERWVETSLYGCHKDGMPLGDYKACGYRYINMTPGEEPTSYIYFSVPCGNISQCKYGGKTEEQLMEELNPDELTFISTSTYVHPTNIFYATDGIKELYIGECVKKVYTLPCNWKDDPCNIVEEGPHSNFYLEKVAMADSVVELGGATFIGQVDLSEVILSERLQIIGPQTFYGCWNLSGVTLPNSLEYIGERAFEECYNFSSITIPSGVTTIGGWAFEKCSGITSVTFAEGSIFTNPDAQNGGGMHMFHLCSNLSEINLPPNLENISVAMFAECRSLPSITIPSGVTYIGESAFYECNSLSSITIPSGVTYIGAEAFKGCRNLQSITVNAATPPTLSEEYTSEGAFVDTNNCPIYVPCDSVNNYKLNLSWSTYADRIQGIPPCGEGYKVLGKSGVLDYYVQCNSSTTLVSSEISNVSTITSAQIGDCVETLGDAFDGATSLTSITINDSVTSIGDIAFRNCSGLTSITISDSVTNIGINAFVNCSGLISVTIGSGITSIAEGAFYDCSRLTSITINRATPPTLGRYAFRDTNNCPIYVPAASVNAYKSASSWSDYTNRIQAIS